MKHGVATWESVLVPYLPRKTAKNTMLQRRNNNNNEYHRSSNEVNQYQILEPKLEERLKNRYVRLYIRTMSI